MRWFCVLLGLAACTPSQSLETYTEDVRPEITQELDAITDKGLDKLCDMNMSRTVRQIEKRGQRWGMGIALMCQDQWTPVGEALKSAESVPPPTFERN